jgi:hypothetical protein
MNNMFLSLEWANGVLMIVLGWVSYIKFLSFSSDFQSLLLSELTILFCLSCTLLTR